MTTRFQKITLAALATVTLATAVVSTAPKAQAADAGAIIAGAVIGGAAGLIVGSAMAPRPVYVEREDYVPTRRVCERRERFNQWGEFVGYKKVCFRVAVDD